MAQTLQQQLEALNLSSPLYPNNKRQFIQTILDYLNSKPPENINLSNINLTDEEKNQLRDSIVNPDSSMALNHRSRELLRNIVPFITMSAPAPEIQGGRRKSRRSRRSRRRRRTRRY